MFVDKADSCILMDVKIAGYLLSPEDPPNSLETLMQRYRTDVGPDKVRGHKIIKKFRKEQNVLYYKSKWRKRRK